MLVEKGELTSGSTHHAAGLVTQFNPSPTMMRFRRYSVELYRELGVFETVGSCGSRRARKACASCAAASAALTASASTPSSSGPERCGACARSNAESLYGAVWMADDGYVDPHIATYAVAGAARELGADVRMPHARHRDRARVRDARCARSLTERADRDGHVVNAAGMWAPQIAAMAGTFVCSIPVDHQHIALHAVAGDELAA